MRWWQRRASSCSAPPMSTRSLPGAFVAPASSRRRLRRARRRVPAPVRPRADALCQGVPGVAAARGIGGSARVCAPQQLVRRVATGSDASTYRCYDSLPSLCIGSSQHSHYGAEAEADTQARPWQRERGGRGLPCSLLPSPRPRSAGGLPLSGGDRNDRSAPRCHCRRPGRGPSRRGPAPRPPAPLPFLGGGRRHRCRCCCAPGAAEPQGGGPYARAVAALPRAARLGCAQEALVCAYAWGSHGSAPLQSRPLSCCCRGSPSAPASCRSWCVWSGRRREEPLPPRSYHLRNRAPRSPPRRRPSAPPHPQPPLPPCSCWRRLRLAAAASPASRAAQRPSPSPRAP